MQCRRMDLNVHWAVIIWLNVINRPYRKGSSTGSLELCVIISPLAILLSGCATPAVEMQTLESTVKIVWTTALLDGGKKKKSEKNRRTAHKLV